MNPGPRTLLAQLASRLTEDERRIMELLGRGMTREEVAEEMAMSVRTVGRSISRVTRLMGANSTMACLAWLTALDAIDPIVTATE